jgi:two-component sensor histidine kinase
VGAVSARRHRVGPQRRSSGYETDKRTKCNRRGVKRLNQTRGKWEVMRWIIRILTWRSHQPAPIRWLEAAALFSIAFGLRWSMGLRFGPLASFYPAILVSTVLLGWKEAIFLLVLSLLAGWCFFLPASLSLFLVAWALAGALNIAIIIALKALAERLAEANERQRVLFAELQHRVANTLQIAIGKLESIGRTMHSDPDACTSIVEDAILRMSASAEMHRRLYDPGLFNIGVGVMLREIVTTIIDQPAVALDLQVEELDLTLDQKSVLAMLVMEVANNSAKHVFQPNLGSRFELNLRALPGGHAMLSMRDDGPGAIAASDLARSHPPLGMRILRGLADQLNGTMATEVGPGNLVTVNFPVPRRFSVGACASQRPLCWILPLRRRIKAPS